MEATKEPRKESSPLSFLGNLSRTPQKKEGAKGRGTYVINSGDYICARAEAVPSMGNHLAVILSEGNVTVLTKEEEARHLKTKEILPEKYVLVEIKCGDDPSARKAAAEIWLSISKGRRRAFMVTGYASDSLLVSAEDIPSVKSGLDSAGFRDSSRR